MTNRMVVWLGSCALVFWPASSVAFSLAGCFVGKPRLQCDSPKPRPHREGSEEHNSGRPARIHVVLPSVEEARLSLAHVIDACPGSHHECYGNRKLEKARRLWIEQKHHFQSLLTMALEAEKQGWKNVEETNAKL